MQRVDLNSGWKFRPKGDRFQELARAAVDWVAVTLPHDAVIGTSRSPQAGPASGYFEGGRWEYVRSLDVTADDAGKTVVLDFEGVYRDAHVYVNDVLMAHRPYGYASFTAQIDPVLNFGGDNTLRVEALAGQDSRWYTGGGIYRNVWLLTSGRVHLAPDTLQVTTPEIDPAGAIVEVSVQVRNQDTTTVRGALRIELLDAAGAVVTSDQAPVTVTPGESATAQRRLFIADPSLWGEQNPYLYSCRAVLVVGADDVDQDSTRFGIRSLTVDPQRGLRVNGEPVKLRGACVHHDNGALGAATIARADERRVQLLKAAGFNAIRSAHNPMSRAMLDACDRHGVFVMDETFDIWTQSKTAADYSTYFAEWWEADVEAMVRTDINHPSVIMYSIGNEIPDGTSQSGIEFARLLSEKVRTLDPTRYVTQAVSGLLAGGAELFAEMRDAASTAPAADESTEVNTAMTSLADVLPRLMRSPVVAAKTAESCSYLDIAGYNYMETRYDLDAELFPNRVIVATETHPTSVDVGWGNVRKHSHVIGDFTWTGWDYLGEAGVGRVEYGAERSPIGMTSFEGPYPSMSAWCGDLDLIGDRRPQSYYREIVFGLRQAPYIAVCRPEHHDKLIVHSSQWSWSDSISSWSWDVDDGAPITVEVYSDADEVELLVNGESLGRRPAGAAHRFRARFEASYHPGEIEAVAWRGGVEQGRMSLRSAVGPVELDVAVDRAEIADGSHDCAFVTVTLVDSNGIVDTTADRAVTVIVDGPGVLQALGSADPNSEEDFTDAICTTFNGRAVAVIRPTGEGAISVSVSAEGCATQQVKLAAVPRTSLSAT